MLMGTVNILETERHVIVPQIRLGLGNTTLESNGSGLDFKFCTFVAVLAADRSSEISMQRSIMFTNFNLWNGSPQGSVFAPGLSYRRKDQLCFCE